MDILLSNGFEDAVVAFTIKRWNELSKKPLGRTALQKLCYFVKSKGVPLDYDFDIYRYGPYSQELYFRMDDMVADGVVVDSKSTDIAIHGNVKGHTSEYIPGNNMDILLELHRKKLERYKQTIEQVVGTFCGYDLKEMELSSTVHYFKISHDNYYRGVYDKDKVVAKVKEAKGDKFTEEKISVTYDKLAEAGILDWHD